MRTLSIRLDDHTDAMLTEHCQRHGLMQTDAVKAAIGQLAGQDKPTHDAYHPRVRKFFDNYDGELLSTWPVLGEVCHLLPERMVADFAATQPRRPRTQR